MVGRAPTIITLLAALLVAAAGCEREIQSGVSGETEQTVTVLRRGNGGDPQSLDPAKAEDVHAFNVLVDLYEGLVTLGANGDLIPGVAENWDIGKDGLTYTFHLRENALWSNGQPVRADDFVAGFERTLAPSTQSAYSFLLHPIKAALAVSRGELPVSALGVTATDVNTLTIELQNPAPHFLSVLAMPVAFPVWSDGPERQDRFTNPDYFVGNGAYLLDHWQPGDRIRVRKNEQFHAAQMVEIDVVEYYPIQDLLTEFNMYRAGELDITATVPDANVQSIRESRRSELRIAPSLAIYYLAFDVSEPPLDDVALRQALTMAIDRRALTKRIGRGERPAYGLVPDGVTHYTPARFAWHSLADSEREDEARRLLASSGHAKLKPLRLKLTYDAGDIHERIALAVSSMWHEVLGVDVELDKREWKYFLDTRDDREQWQIMRFAWSGDYDHPSTFAGILHSASPHNLPGYRNADYDELVDQALTTQNFDVQSTMLASAEALMLADYPIAPLYFYVSKHLVSPAVTGFHDNVLDRHPSRFLRLRPQAERR